MTNPLITIETIVAAPPEKAFAAYVDPAHIIHWNFASPDWHCPAARSEQCAGGSFSFRMEAKDGSFGFDFEGEIVTFEPPRLLHYRFGDRQARVNFTAQGEGTRVNVAFEAEAENPLEMQREGWQAILNNYKAYLEAGL